MQLLRSKPLAQALCAVAEEEAKEAEGSPPQRLTEPPTVGAADEAGDDHEHGVPKTGEIVSWLSLPRDPEGEDMRLRRALTEIRVRCDPSARRVPLTGVRSRTNARAASAIDVPVRGT